MRVIRPVIRLETGVAENIQPLLLQFEKRIRGSHPRPEDAWSSGAAKITHTFQTQRECRAPDARQGIG